MQMDATGYSRWHPLPLAKELPMSEQSIEVEWREVPWSGGCYFVSNTGLVRSAPSRGNKGKGRVMKLAKDGRKGYMRVSCHCGGKKHTKSVHGMVAEAFIGPRPFGMEVNHKNGIKHDNRAENLEYVTGSENVLHSMHTLGRIKTRPRGEKHYYAKLCAQSVTEIRAAFQSGGVTKTDLASRYGVTTQTIWQVVTGVTWRHLLCPA